MPIAQLSPGFLAENGTYEFFVLLGGEKLTDDYDLLLNDIPAERIRRKGTDFFRYSVGFFAGELRVAVVTGSHVIACVDLTIDPDLLKLTRDEYGKMLREIASSTLALYRMGGVTVPAETGAAGQRLPLVTLELIRANFDQFARAVSRIADQPTRRLRSRRNWTDTWRARKLDDRSIGEAFRRGKVRSATDFETRAAPTYVSALRGNWTPIVPERRQEEYFAVYENEAIAGFLDWLHRFLASSATKLYDQGVTGSVWGVRIAKWQAQISSLRRRIPFANISPTPFLRPTSVFRMHPDYATAFTTMMRMKGGLGAGSGLAPAVPIDQTYRLYELWFYVVLLASAAEHFPQCLPDVSRLLTGIQLPRQLGASLATGKDSRLQLTPEISLIYQRRFSPTKDAEGAGTLLIDAIPDVVFGRVNANGEAASLIIMDPKYRRGASLLDGVRDLHVYRDCIIGKAGKLTMAAIAVSPAPSSLTDSDPFRSDRPTIMRATPGNSDRVFRELLLGAITSLEDAVPPSGEPIKTIANGQSQA